MSGKACHVGGPRCRPTTTRLASVAGLVLTCEEDRQTPPRSRSVTRTRATAAWCSSCSHRSRVSGGTVPTGSVSMLEAIETHRLATSRRSALICASVSASFGALMAGPCGHRHHSSASPRLAFRDLRTSSSRMHGHRALTASIPHELSVVAKYTHPTGPRLSESPHCSLVMGVHLGWRAATNEDRRHGGAGNFRGGATSHRERRGSRGPCA